MSQNKVHYITPNIPLDIVNNFSYSKGDIVRFQCGGLWRGQLKCQSDVTYNAYGMGKKPCFYNSIDAFNSDLWYKIGYGDIWVYDHKIELDVGIIIFDDGNSWGVKKLDGIEEISEEGDFFHNPVDKRIYLCSSNNPALIFKYSIEMGINEHIIFIADNHNITIENLCIKYGGAHGITGFNCSDITIRDCELAWIGGSIQHKKIRYGNAIEFWMSCNNILVENCYIYQIYDAALTHQYNSPANNNENENSDVFMCNILYHNNLIEQCTYSFEYFLDSRSQKMTNIEFSGNICKYAGMGWGNQRLDKFTAAHVKSWDHYNGVENFTIKNNVFDRSEEMLIHIGGTSELPSFDSNYYIQYRNAKFGMFNRKIITFSDDIKKLIVPNIDENGVVIVI